MGVGWLLAQPQRKFLWLLRYLISKSALSHRNIPHEQEMKIRHYSLGNSRTIFEAVQHVRT